MRARWIIGPRWDIGWFLLPALSGYVLIWLNAVGISSFLLWWFFNVSVNGPHFFATISRTYLDTEEWRRRPALLIGSAAFFLVGPAVIGASLALGTRVPFVVFWLLQAFWAYYHVARQHYGFMALYQRHNGETVGRENRADFLSFNFLMFAPALVWFLQYPLLREALGWRPRPSGPEAWWIDALRISIIVVITGFVLKEVLAFRRTGRVNLPKLGLLAAYVPLHLLLFLHPGVAARSDLLLVNAVVTFPHSVQYVALVWFQNRNRYGRGADPGRYGLASRVSGGVVRFLCSAAVFGLVAFYADWYFEGSPVPFSLGHFRYAEMPLGEGFRLSHLAAVVWLGVIFNHQYLDQRIWHIRSDPRLNEDLRLTAPLAPALGRA